MHENEQTVSSTYKALEYIFSLIQDLGNDSKLNIDN